MHSWDDPSVVLVIERQKRMGGGDKVDEKGKSSKSSGNCKL